MGGLGFLLTKARGKFCKKRVPRVSCILQSAKHKDLEEPNFFYRMVSSKNEPK
jgi:hypothetical protein